MKTLLKNAMLLGLLLLSGCAFTAAGRTRMYFDSEPQGATVKLKEPYSDEYSGECVTPCELEFKRGRGEARWVEFSLEGHKPCSFPIAPRPGVFTAPMRGHGVASLAFVVPYLMINDANWPAGVVVILPEIDSPDSRITIR